LPLSYLLTGREVYAPYLQVTSAEPRGEVMAGLGALRDIRVVFREPLPQTGVPVLGDVEDLVFHAGMLTSQAIAAIGYAEGAGAPTDGAALLPDAVVRGVRSWFSGGAGWGELDTCFQISGTPNEHTGSTRSTSSDEVTARWQVLRGGSGKQRRVVLRFTGGRVEVDCDAHTTRVYNASQETVWSCAVRPEMLTAGGYVPQVGMVQEWLRLGGSPRGWDLFPHVMRGTDVWLRVRQHTGLK
jgi:hypothetical protein